MNCVMLDWVTMNSHLCAVQLDGFVGISTGSYLNYPVVYVQRTLWTLLMTLGPKLGT